MSYGVNIYRLVPARRDLCGQDFERRQARRSSRGAADEVRVDHQSQSREADRINRTTQCFGSSRSSYPMIEQSKTVPSINSGQALSSAEGSKIENLK